MTHDAFLEAARRLLGEARVADADAVVAASLNLQGLERQLPGVVRASSVEDVRAVLALAIEHHVSVMPWSCGRNWGYGTRLPPRPDTYGLDLSAMAQVGGFDSLAGTVRVEPGVSQGQLASWLDQHGEGWTLDATGASLETSVLGNTLERGIAYNSLRADSLRHLEVVLADGRLLPTGYAHYANCLVANGYRHGIGPNLTELFLQSNLGVVVGATVALRPPREARVAFQASLRPGGDMPAFVEALAAAKRELGLDSIVHVADRERTLGTLAPMVRARAASLGRELSREAAEAVVARVLSRGWNALGLVEGTRGQVRVTLRALRRRLRRFGPVKPMWPDRLARLAKIGRALGLWRLALVAESAHEVSGLALGRPTDGPLRSVHWPFYDDDPDWREPEQARSGWAIVAPLFPLRKEDIAAVRASVREVTERHSVQVAMTINLITESVAQGLITLGWRLADTDARDRVHQCQRELTGALLELGYPPYRAALGEMDVVTGRSEFWDVARELKTALDPHGVIAPGRYIPDAPIGSTES